MRHHRVCLRRTARLLAGCVLPALLSQCAFGGDIVFTNALVIGSVGRAGRETTHTDAIEARIVAGAWRQPSAQDTVAMPDGRAQVWEAATANKDGWFEHRAFRGGYAFTGIEVDQPRVMILQAAGHSAVYVNGEIRTGDPYAHGYLQVPVWLDSGTNEFLFHVSRGRFRARLTEPKASALLNPADTTLPDLLAGEREPAWAGIVALDASASSIGTSPGMSKPAPAIGGMPRTNPAPTASIGRRCSTCSPAAASRP